MVMHLVCPSPPQDSPPCVGPEKHGDGPQSQSVGQRVLCFAALSSVPRLCVELCADVLDDPGDGFVQVVKLIHKEGVLPGRVSGNDLQLVLCSPCNTYCIGDHSCGDKDQMKQIKSVADESLPFCCPVSTTKPNPKSEMCQAKEKTPMEL